MVEERRLTSTRKMEAPFLSDSKTEMRNRGRGKQEVSGTHVQHFISVHIHTLHKYMPHILPDPRTPVHKETKIRLSARSGY